MAFRVMTLCERHSVYYCEDDGEVCVPCLDEIRAQPHPEIPVGPYCYRIDGTREHAGAQVPRTIPCPHWRSIGDRMGRCCLLGLEDKEPQGPTLLWDQCKACGINDPDPDTGAREVRP